MKTSTPFILPVFFCIFGFAAIPQAVAVPTPFSCKKLLLPVEGSLGVEIDMESHRLTVLPHAFTGSRFRPLRQMPDIRNEAEAELLDLLAKLPLLARTPRLQNEQARRAIEKAAQFYMDRGILNELLSFEDSPSMEQIEILPRSGATTPPALAALPPLSALATFLQGYRSPSILREAEPSPLIHSVETLILERHAYENEQEGIDLHLLPQTLVVDRIPASVFHELYHWLQDYMRKHGIAGAWPLYSIAQRKKLRLETSAIAHYPLQPRQLKGTLQFVRAYLSAQDHWLIEEAGAFQLDGLLAYESAVQYLASEPPLRKHAFALFEMSSKMLAISTLLASNTGVPRLTDHLENTIQENEKIIGQIQHQCAPPSTKQAKSR